MNSKETIKEMGKNRKKKHLSTGWKHQPGLNLPAPEQGLAGKLIPAGKANQD